MVKKILGELEKLEFLINEEIKTTEESYYMESLDKLDRYIRRVTISNIEFMELKTMDERFLQLIGIVRYIFVNSIMKPSLYHDMYFILKGIRSIINEENLKMYGERQNANSTQNLFKFNN